MNNGRSDMELLVNDIRNKAKHHISINKVDEINVMKCMLNDSEFSLGVYDKNIGYVGQRCPHDEAVLFIKDVIAGATGLDRKESEIIASNYEFTKRNANYLINNMRDFMSVYMATGRKFNIMQTANTEATLHTKDVQSVKKQVPDRDRPGETKEIETTPYTKLVSVTKCPKYKEKE